MNIVGNIEFTSDIVDGFDAPELHDAFDIAHKRINGTDYLYVSGYGDDGLQVLTLDGDGQISAVQSVPYSSNNNLDGPGNIDIASFGGESYVIVTSSDDDALSVFRIDNDNTGTNGHLQLTDSITASDLTGFSAALDYAYGLEVFSFNNRAIALAGGYYGDGIASFEIDSNGEITFLDAVFDSDATAHELDGPEKIKGFEIGSKLFVFVGTSGDDGISVFELNKTTGALSNVFNLNGGQDYISVLPITYNGENLLIGSGSGYIDVFRIHNNGSLTFLKQTNDEDANSYYPHNFEEIVIDGVPFLAATDEYNSDRLALYGIDDDYNLVQVQEATGSPAFDDADGTVQVTIGSRVFLVTAVSDTHRVTVAEVGGSSEALLGTDEADRMVGQNGDDDLLGKGGADELIGGNGEDVLIGHYGADTLKGGAGADVLVGGLGNDVLLGGAGPDILKGGLGTDKMTYATSGAGVKVNLGNGLASGGDAAGDYFVGIENLEGSSYADQLSGDSGKNKILGLGGADKIWGNEGNDTILGGQGRDTLSGGSGSDKLDGNDGADIVNGNNGWDEVSGGNGADTLYGGGGSDVLKGGSGEDVLTGGTGDDTMTGGSESDTFVFSGAFGNDEVTDFQTGAGGDVLDFQALTAMNSVADFKAAAFSIAGNTIVTFPDPSKSITLYGVHENDFTADNFLF